MLHFSLLHNFTYKTLELQRKAESYFQHTKSTISSDTRQSMKRQIIAKHLDLGSVRRLAIIRCLDVRININID